MRYDAVIVGGGLVGATLALALGEMGLRVAVVERSSARVAAPGPVYGMRVSAFTVASERILRALGVWPELPAERVGPIRRMHVWEHTGKVHFDSAGIGEPVLGHIIENAVVQWVVEQRIEALPNVEWHRGAEVAGLAVDGGEALVTLPDRRLRATLVAGADGAGSRIRELAGIGITEGDYHQEAVVAEVRTAMPHRETAWQRFLPTGPLAFLPLANGASSIVWSTTPEHAAHLCALDADAFGFEVADAFEWRLGAVSAPGTRASFPLRHLHARAYVRDRVALAGDAAHVVHPLAGQGVNLGLLDAAALAEVVGRARGLGRDVGSRATLRRYERWRRGHNALMQAVLGGFRHLFSSPWTPVRRLRETGFALTDRIPPLKAGFMRFASGFGGDLPALARGAPFCSGPSNLMQDGGDVRERPPRSGASRHSPASSGASSAKASRHSPASAGAGSAKASCHSPASAEAGSVKASRHSPASAGTGSANAGIQVSREYRRPVRFGRSRDLGAVIPANAGIHPATTPVPANAGIRNAGTRLHRTGATMTALFETDIPGLELIGRGKVRDIYAAGDEHLLIVATDRLSAFDVVLPDPIPGKGAVLTELSRFWFSRIEGIVRNHCAAVGIEVFVADVGIRASIADQAMVVRRLVPLPIEAIVRGYLIGSGWRDYQRTGKVCGIDLPAGLKQADKLPEPVFTPSTKAAAGAHDENIDFEAAAALVGRELAERIRDTSIRVYREAADFAASRGIVIADTKFEFALDADGELVLIDEVLTPDSSRFWPANRYAPGTSPPSFDKQFVRDYLETLDWDKTPPAPALPAGVVEQTSRKYREAFERITGVTSSGG